MLCCFDALLLIGKQKLLCLLCNILREQFLPTSKMLNFIIIMLFFFSLFRSNININDVLGDYSLGLLESLGTLAVSNDNETGFVPECCHTNIFLLSSTLVSCKISN